MTREHGPQQATVADAVDWAWSNARKSAHLAAWEVASGRRLTERAVRIAAQAVESSRWALETSRRYENPAYTAECVLRLERASLRLAAALARLWRCPRKAVVAVRRTARALELQVLEMYREAVNTRAELAALADERRA